MLARTTTIALTALIAWTFTATTTLAQESEPKPQTEAEAEARFGVKSAPEPKPQSEPQVEHALSQTSYTRGGWYIGAAGLAAVEFSPYVEGPDKHIVNWGFNFRMGNRHSRWLATEIQGTYINTYETVDPDGTPDSEFRLWGIWVSERIYFTKSRYQPYITGGLGVIQIRNKIGGSIAPNPEDPLADVQSAWGFSSYFGLGIEFYWTENIITTLGISYYITTGAISDHDFATAGIGFQFF